MNVDTHVHVLGADRQKYPRKPNPEMPWTSEDFTVESLLGQMDACGIDKAVLVQAYNAYRCDNGYVADMAARYPARFAAVGVLDADDPDSTGQLDDWVHRGVRGLRLMLPGPARVDDVRVFQLAAAAARHSIPVCIFTRFEQVPQLSVLLERIPGLVLALDHMGLPALDEGPPYASLGPLFELKRFPGFHLKFSSTTVFASMRGRSTPRELFGRMVGEFGAHRLMWGSNYPMNAESDVKGLFTAAQDALAFLPEAERRQLLGEAALGLWQFPQPG